MNDTERELLLRARRALEPSPGKLASLRARVLATAASPAPAPPSSGLIGWLGVGVGIGLLALGVWSLAPVGQSREAPHEVLASTSLPDTVRVELAPDPSIESAPIHIEPTSDDSSEASEVPPTRRADGDRLAQELRLVAQARQALVRDDADAALRALSRHARVFPDGAFVEERLAIQVLALCAASREDEARAASAAFVARYPLSVSLPALRSSCAPP